MQRLLRAASAALCLSLSALAADTVAPGFSRSSLPNPAFGAQTATLPNGDLVTYDGLSVDRWTAGGAFVQNLATFQVFGFPSFVRVRPDGTEVLIGESSNHAIHRVPLDGSGEILVANVVFNFAAAFETNDDLILSAATGDFGPQNEILRLDLTSGQETTIAVVPGPSGPVAFDLNGDLLYATQSTAFPPPPGSTDVVRWTSTQITSGAQLSLVDATVVSAGFDGGGSMAVDPVSGVAYLAETNFDIPVNRIVRVGSSAATSTVVVDSTETLGQLQFTNAGGAGSFEAFQPSGGSQLRYSATDFATIDDLALLDPARPTLTISGPGVTGVGPVTLAVDGALPNGSAFLLFSFQGALTPTEQTYTFPGFLLHSRFVPGKIRRVPFFLPVDAAGHGEVTFQNPGNLAGTFGWQYWIATATGQFLGSTPTETF